MSNDFLTPKQHIPQINKGDTFQFTRNVGLVAVTSVGYQVIDPAGTTIVTSGIAVQSGTSSNWNVFYTLPTSWWTTVYTTSLYQLEWDIHRTTGDDKEVQYFESISFVLDDV